MIKKILLIDDDIDFTQACRNFLEAANFEVELENEDEKAVERIRSFKPDLVLLDVMMSRETSGFEIAEKMFSDKELRNIPVIMLTGFFKRTGSDADKEALSKWKNIRFVLDKPIKPSILLSVVRKI